MRCKCGRCLLLPENGTGSKTTLEGVTLGAGLKWETHTVSKCEGYVSLEVDNGTSGFGRVGER